MLIINFCSRHLRWNTGEVIFDYLTQSQDLRDPLTGRWSQFKAANRVVGIIGLLDYNSMHSLVEKSKSTTHVSSKILIELEKIKR